MERIKKGIDGGDIFGFLVTDEKNNLDYRSTGDKNGTGQTQSETDLRQGQQKTKNSYSTQ